MSSCFFAFQLAIIGNLCYNKLKQERSGAMDSEYKNVKKIFDICAILQCLYCLGCIVGMLGWLLYCEFYPSNFSEICFRIGVTTNIYSCLTPIGLICWILMLVSFCKKNSLIQIKKIKSYMIIWLTISPIITALCWMGAAKTFLIQVSGV